MRVDQGRPRWRKDAWRLLTDRRLFGAVIDPTGTLREFKLTDRALIQGLSYRHMQDGVGLDERQLNTGGSCSG